mgnify:CR=1 FL=1
MEDSIDIKEDKFLMIGVKEQTKKSLFELKEFDETYEDVIIRLIRFYKEKGGLDVLRKGKEE